MNPIVLAREVLKKYWNQTIPVNLDSIAHSMGIQVNYLPVITEGCDYSGSFEYQDGVPVCSVRSTDPYTRRRFTLAHEMGHYVLQHQSGLRDNSENFGIHNHDSKEVDANNFAAELLMPAQMVHHLVQNMPDLTLGDMAGIFEVSTTAMTFRLRNLGYQL